MQSRPRNAQLHILCVAPDASRRALISQREHCGERAGGLKRVASAPKSAKLRHGGTYGGKQMSNRFTQYILIAMVLGIVMGALIFNYLPDSRGDIAADRQPDRDAVPAPDQDDHCAPGVCDPSRRHRAYGQRRQTRADFRQDHGLVCQCLVRLAAARPRHGQSAAARRQFPRHPAGQGAIDRPAGIGVLDREIPDPSDSDLDRGRDGAERNPADRGVRGVLLGRAGRDAGPLQADTVGDR